ncbi:flavin-containing monooxygenase 5-like isoform X3 [Neopsephotus bourkii]|uniref:flavin-containing monooxygenase 5-like isoform X3 n=1 Tax=Neopsephotus bourkii TaxID=309878 RepID=UPI002AA5B578|nr:flavin-containing monooxygenase 5-like isoform X3 [Neopsephotus bourkii]
MLKLRNGDGFLQRQLSSVDTRSQRSSGMFWWDRKKRVVFLLISELFPVACMMAYCLLQDSMVRSVAIIGAGVSGLASVKCCLDEGLEPTCFERSEDIGGLWRYTNSMDSGRFSVYRSVITNTSKEMSCFSDFPCPEYFPSYLPHSLLMEYFRMYARHFDLLRHIHFKTTVLSVRRRPDFATSGQWEVVTETNGVQKSHIFDAVMVCTGHFQEPYLPLASFPGIDTRFKGQYLHSQEYKDAEAFRGKRVLVVGIGNTGGDLSVELSHVAAKMLTLLSSFPPASSNFKVIINEELPFCLLSGTIVLKSNVKEFTENSAVFEDGTTEENIDVVLFATGYIFPFSFLEESVRSLFDDNRSLYKRIFPPQLEKPTLAIIGLVQLTGSVMVGAEMQARWVTGIFAGWNKLPPTSKMMADVLKQKPPVESNPSERKNLKMSYISYIDEIASCAGIKPSVMKLLLTDPRLALAIFFGPCSPYQYRLVGQGKWRGARDAILTQWQRTLKPLRTRVVDDSSNSSSSWHWMCLLVLPAALMAGFLFSKYPRLGWSPQAGPQL